MSILIADSGATKTEWCLVNDETETHFTEGLNPYYHTTESIEEIIRQNLLPKIEVPIDEVFFYGAGVIVTRKIKWYKKRSIPVSLIQITMFITIC